MNIHETSKFLTLDWDNIDLQAALVKFIDVIGSPNTYRAILSRSPRGKGFHCRVYLHYRVLVAVYRFRHGDDPRRLLHDLFNSPDNIHDILWSRKTVHGNAHKAKVLIDYAN